MTELSWHTGLQLQPDLLSEVLNQLYKDTGLTADELPWDRESDNGYDAFHTTFKGFVSRWFNSDRTRFMQLLYRVDIAESQYRRVLLVSDEETRTQKLTDLILNRVLQKVFTRLNYKP